MSVTQSCWAFGIMIIGFIIAIVSVAAERQERIKELEEQLAKSQERNLELVALNRIANDRVRACGAVSSVADIHAGRKWKEK